MIAELKINKSVRTNIVVNKPLIEEPVVAIGTRTIIKEVEVIVEVPVEVIVEVPVEVPVPATHHPYVITLSFPAGREYYSGVIAEEHGSWVFKQSSNISTYFLRKNNGAWQVNQGSETFSPGDIYELRIVKSNIADTASLSFDGDYNLTTLYSKSYSGKLKKLDQWMVDMFNHYQLVNENQLDTTDMVEEFFYRLQPDYTLKNKDGSTNSIGYAYNTFGPSGLNKTDSYWIVMIRMASSITLTGTNYLRFSTSVKVDVDGFNSVGVGSSNVDTYSCPTKEYYISFYFTDRPTICYIQNQRVRCKLPHQGKSFTTLISNTWLYGGLTNKFNAHPAGVRDTNMTGIHPGITTGQTTNYFDNNRFTGVKDEAFLTLATTNLTTFANNDFVQAEIDRFLKNLKLGLNGVTPTVNRTINISGPNMAAPTGGANNADILAMQAIYASRGLVLTVIITT